MARTIIIPKNEPLLNIASYARSGPRAAGRLTPSQIEHIRLTVNRAPEVVVKVLPKGSNDLKAVGKHIDYIGRHGKLELEGDDGERLHGRVADVLLQDWDLDVDDLRRQGSLCATSKRTPPKLVHKLTFSMPPGTPQQKVLTAVRNFAREEFFGQHRYTMALHTDEPHPHVHLVLKAMGENGERLRIGKQTLRRWREGFAHELRKLGVSANATSRFDRGQTRTPLRDGIFRAAMRGESTHLRDKAFHVAKFGRIPPRDDEPGKHRMLRSRATVRSAWNDVAVQLRKVGQHALADAVATFVQRMMPVRTDNEILDTELPSTRSSARESTSKQAVRPDSDARELQR